METSPQKKEQNELPLSQEERDLILENATRKIKEGRFSELDPTIGDNACHIRALCISRIGNTFLSGQSLSPEEIEYLIGVEFTATASASLFSRNGMLINDQSGLTLPSYLRKKYSCRQREVICKKFRESVAELGLNLFAKYLNSLPESPSQKALLMSLTQDQRTLDRCSECIKCIPQFTSWAIINEIIQSSGLKFIVVFKTYGLVDNGNGINLLNVRPVVFTKDNETGTYIPAETVDDNDQTACACFEVSSIVEPHSSSVVDLAGLVLDLKTWSIIDVLSACFALHCQYGKIREENPCPSFMADTAAETRSLLGDQYSRIIKAAEKLTIIQDRPFFRLDPETLCIRVEPKLISGGHAYCSTWNNVLGYCNKLCRKEVIYKLVQFDKKTNSYHSSLEKFNELQLQKKLD